MLKLIKFLNMKATICFLITLFFMTISSNAQDENFHIYLCFGQSNMEGSAPIEEQDQIGNPRFKMLQTLDCENLERTKGAWITAVPPLTHCNNGLSPADYFGRTMVENLPKEITVGVLNIAVGGCDIRMFDKEIYKDYLDTYKEDWFTEKVVAYEYNPYKYFITLAKEAKKKGVIKGILLHQGETNTGDENWPQYVKTVYDNLISDLELDAEEVPLLAGELVHEEQEGLCARHNEIIQTLPEAIPTAHVISSKGCEVRDDKVHFNSAGVRELGRRYALKMLELQY